ncbi:MAG: RsmB/NOP family class I SAM-dependent RNA methyltransferase [Candidatus Thorarchaeota archaeon]|nr:RsmB/NOP family class I SAM-dependent RNA methyltransferase [Candidatus Thorarchaeota archaeon]
MSRRPNREKARELAIKHGYLEYMIERYLALWGEDETLQFIEACERPVRSSIRVNTLKTDAATLREILRTKDVITEPVNWLPEGLWADFDGTSPGSLLEHMRGFYYVQGVPSMTVARVLEPQAGEVVVDLASAPGGKTTHLAQLMDNTGTIFTVEQDRLRIRALEMNLQRCGVTNAIVLRGDAKKVLALGLDPDRILLDAPCSGEGLIPIDPTRKTSKTMADLRYCATREEEMLDLAVAALAPGGVLVYSTCSIAPEEGEYVVDGVLRRHSDLSVAPITMEFGDPGYSSPYGVELDGRLVQARRFLPHRHGTEGFFICKLTKDG